MERHIAVKKLTKLLGKNMGYQVNPKAPDADERAEVMTALGAITAEREEAEAKMKARRRAVLDGDAEYNLLLANYERLRLEADKLRSRSYGYRFTAGISNSLFFHVKAQGDSWEEVIAKIEEREC
jgi:hypothetical protein